MQRKKAGGKERVNMAVTATVDPIPRTPRHALSPASSDIIPLSRGSRAHRATVAPTINSCIPSLKSM